MCTAWRRVNLIPTQGSRYRLSVLWIELGGLLVIGWGRCEHREVLDLNLRLFRWSKLTSQSLCHHHHPKKAKILLNSPSNHKTHQTKFLDLTFTLPRSVNKTTRKTMIKMKNYHSRIKQQANNRWSQRTKKARTS